MFHHENDDSYKFGNYTAITNGTNIVERCLKRRSPIFTQIILILWPGLHAMLCTAFLVPQQQRPSTEDRFAVTMITEHNNDQLTLYTATFSSGFLWRHSYNVSSKVQWIYCN